MTFTKMKLDVHSLEKKIIIAQIYVIYFDWNQYFETINTLKINNNYVLGSKLKFLSNKWTLKLIPNVLGVIKYIFRKREQGIFVVKKI